MIGAIAVLPKLATPSFHSPRIGVGLLLFVTGFCLVLPAAAVSRERPSRESVVSAVAPALQSGDPENGTWDPLDPPGIGPGHSVVYDASHERLIRFGGPSVYSAYSNETWAYSLVEPRGWTKLQPAGQLPEGRSDHTAIYDPLYNRMIVFGGVVNGYTYLNDVWALSLGDVPEWTQVLPAGSPPGARSLHAAVYEPIHDQMQDAQMIIFGGLGLSSPNCSNEVWALSLGEYPTWRPVAIPGISPSPRIDHSMIYDSTLNRVIVFGGEGSYTTFDDTWALTLDPTPLWSEITTGTRPAAREAHGAVLDAPSGRMIVFGGYTYNPLRPNTYHTDTWALSLTNDEWSELAPAGNPPSVSAWGRSAIIDPARRQMVVLNNSQPSEIDALSLTGDPQWSALYTWNRPSGRYDPSAIYDPPRDRIVVFGGQLGWPDYHYSDETWTLSLSGTREWTRLVPSGTPPTARNGHLAIYDPFRDRMIIVGGMGEGGGTCTTWALTLGEIPTWVQLTPSGNPPCNDYGVGIYDPVADRMVVYDPSYAPGTVSALSLGENPEWTELTIGGDAPPRRFWSSAIYDPIRERMIIFGGWGSGSFNDVWALSLRGAMHWEQLTPSGTAPSARYDHSAIYDPVRQRMVVSGGCCVPYNDTWALSLSGSPQWTQLTPVGDLPATRRGASAIYDPVRDRMVIFGGLGGSSQYYTDTWALTWGTPAPPPSISQLLPGTVNFNDTGVDLLVEGSGFQDGASIVFSPVITMHGPTYFWSDKQLHVNCDIDLIGPLPPPITVRVRNPDGRLSNELTLSVNPLALIPHPREFAPTFWFAPDEKWFPTSPFFPYAGKTTYTSPSERNDDYLSQPFETRRNLATVYYWIYGTHPDEPLLPLPNSSSTDPCYVYEYWLYYLYDEFKIFGNLPVNKHQHDWERVFVWVRAIDFSVVAVATTDHLENFTPGNEFEFPPGHYPPRPFHLDVIVEEGSHANCPDIDRDHAFKRDVDINHCPGVAWGIHDGVRDASTRAPIAGPGNDSPSYGLVSLGSLRSLVDRPEITDTWHDDNTREAYCASCAPSNRVKSWILGDPPRSRTFIGSRAEVPDPGNVLVDAGQAACFQFGAFLCWNPLLNWYIGHKPVEHAWEGKQAEYLSNPAKALPTCNLVEGRVTSTLSRAERLALLFRYGSGTSNKPSSDVAASAFGYAVVDSNGTVGFDNVPAGLCTFILNAQGAATYQQTLQISDSGASLGVDGNIVLIPEEHSFALKTNLISADSIPIAWATVRVAEETGTRVAESLTDPSGTAWSSLDTSGRYKVVVRYDQFTDSLASISAAAGDTIAVNFRTPFTLVDVQTGPPIKDDLRQCYPNPFNPGTTIEFELERGVPIDLEIVDVRGRLVRQLRTGMVESGWHREYWDARDLRGNRVPSGVYFCRLRAGTFTRTAKLVLAR